MDIVEVSLTSGQVNAVRSAFKAGITRARIARQFGISQSNVRKALATDLSALGHDVKQVPPAYAKPFRQGHKNDFRDAHAVAEAVAAFFCVRGRYGFTIET